MNRSDDKSTSLVRLDRANRQVDQGELVIPSLRDVVQVLFRQRWKMMAVSALVMVAALGFILTRTPVYFSEAKLLIKSERAGLSLDPSAEGLVRGGDTLSRDTLSGELAIFDSTALAERVAAELGPENILPLPEGATLEEYFGDTPNPETETLLAAAGFLGDAIKVSGQGQTITVRVAHPNPASAQAILGEVIEQYMDTHIEVHSSAASPEFFEEKAAEIQAEIDKQQDVLQRLKDNHNITSIDEQRGSAFARIESLETRLSTLRATIEATNARIREYRQLVNKLPAESTEVGEVENPRVLELKNRLLDLELQEIDLAAKYVDSRELRSVREQIAQVKSLIAKLPATIPSGASEGAATDPRMALENERIALQALEAERETITNDLREATNRLSELNTHASSAKMAQMKLEQLQRSYFEVQQGLDRAEVDSRLDRAKVGNVTILQRATLPTEPAGHGRKRDVALALFAAIAAGIAVALVAEYFDDTVKVPKDIERRLGMNVLSTVPDTEVRDVS